jgi:hypothetical protein
VASNYHHEVDFASPAILTSSGAGFATAIPARGEKSDLKREYGLLDIVASLPASIRATAGADYMRERTTLDGFLELFPGFTLPDGYQQSRHVTGAFGELQYSGISGLTLLGSIRHDKPSTTSAQTTGRAGFVYTPDSGDTEFRGYWGQGFKLPSLWALGNALVGNSALLPEKSRSTEVGVSRWLIERRLLVSIAAFDNRFTNLIDFDNNLFHQPPRGHHPRRRVGNALPLCRRLAAQGASHLCPDRSERQRHSDSPTPEMARQLRGLVGAQFAMVAIRNLAQRRQNLRQFHTHGWRLARRLFAF